MNCVIVGECFVGYYCIGGVWIFDFVDNVIGNICFQYYVCKVGLDTFKICFIGYYVNSTGMLDCQLCMAGFLCSLGLEFVFCLFGE